MRFLATLSQFIRRCSDTLTFEFREGSWSLRQYELAVINAALSILDDQRRSLTEKQLDQSFFVERIPDGRINIFRFYDPSGDLRLPLPEFSDLLIKVKLTVEGKQQMAHVTFYSGHIFSVEFKQPAKFYVGKDFEIGEAKIGKSGQSYTHEIDRLEHGETE